MEVVPFPAPETDSSQLHKLRIPSVARAWAWRCGFRSGSAAMMVTDNPAGLEYRILGLTCVFTVLGSIMLRCGTRW
jgi:hypothetical protein